MIFLQALDFTPIRNLRHVNLFWASPALATGAASPRVSLASVCKACVENDFNDDKINHDNGSNKNESESADSEQ